MDSAAELQDLYSSTSSDDQSSINSVVHVDAVLELSDTDSTGRQVTTSSRNDGPAGHGERENGAPSRNGAPERNGRRNGNGTRAGGSNGSYGSGRDSDTEDGRYDSRQAEFSADSGANNSNSSMRNSDSLGNEHHAFMLGEDDSTSEEDEEEQERRRMEEQEERARDSDTSTTSEDTQIWVQASKPHVTTPSQRPAVRPKPGPYPGMTGQPTGKRQSLVSQTSSGRVETRLVVSEEGAAGDSGLSTESPTQSTQGDMSHSQDQHTMRTYIQYMPEPGSSAQSAGRPMSTSTTSSHPAQKRASLGLYQHSSPSHQSSRGSPVIVLQSVPSPSPSPIPPTLLMRNGEPSSQSVQSPLDNGTYVSENLFNILSFLYAMLLVVMGLSFPLAEIFAQSIPVGVFEGFYIYLFAVSIFFLVYVYLFLLRSSTSRCCQCRQQSIEDAQREDTLLNQTLPWRQKAVSLSNQNHTGSFYLRLGAVGFGIGSLIHEGLMFGQQFETELAWECFNLTMVIRPITQLTFTFIQLYFIFLNSKMLIHKYKICARFGLMHMVATNICVWLRVLIIETVREIHGEPLNSNSHSKNGNRSLDPISYNNLPYNNNNVLNPGNGFDEIKFMNLKEGDTHLDHVTTEHTPALIECLRYDIMGHVVKSASPYLYPCTIQYSMIAAGILLIMWRNIGTPAPVTPSSVSDSENDIQRHKKNNRVGMNCSGANRGLFFGIFMLVVIIISMIVFFVLVEKPQFRASSIVITHSSEILLYFLASLAVLIAAIRVRHLKFHRDRDNNLEELLLIIAVTGVYILAIFGLVAGKWCNSSQIRGPLVMASSLLVIFQSTAQTLFIMNGLRRSALSNVHERRKPGREFVTFLLVCNVAMWGMNIFEVLRAAANPIMLEFYGVVAWNIITHVATPLAIFYRFHSIVCLAAIWSSAYKLKTH